MKSHFPVISYIQHLVYPTSWTPNIMNTQHLVYPGSHMSRIPNISYTWHLLYPTSCIYIQDVIPNISYTQHLICLTSNINKIIPINLMKGCKRYISYTWHPVYTTSYIPYILYTRHLVYPTSNIPNIWYTLTSHISNMSGIQEFKIFF
jgi:hypothetical protein